jgi:endoglucanase
MARSARSNRLASIAAPLRLVASGVIMTLAAACSGDASTGLGPVTSSDAATGKHGDTPGTPIGTFVNALAGARLFVDPTSNAHYTAEAWRAARPADAAQLDKIAGQPQVRWFGSWNTNVQHDVEALATTMTAAGTVPVFVAYNIPQRDCGGLSGGNSTTTADAYRQWIAGLADGIGARRAAVILEPDALAGMDCLSPADQQVRVDLLSWAVATLHAKGNIAVYLDAGNPGWQTAATMSARLARAGVALAQGFSLNVSNFVGTTENLAYGTELSALVGGKHFIIDTGRNGLGVASNHEWCNPAGRALGERPTTQTGQSLADAYLWVKAPGESDGVCNGATTSGQWMGEYALGLAQRAAY